MTRTVAHDFRHPDKRLHLQAENLGLAASIIGGVSSIVEAEDSVVVVEDDLVLSPAFLGFMNQALARYRDDGRVMQISGHMFPVDACNSQDVGFFLPFTTSWGWAVWERAWKCFQPDAAEAFGLLSADRGLRARFDLGNSFPYYKMLQRQQAGRVNSWAIRWYASVFFHNGMVLYPRRSLVRNEGFGPDATHTKTVSDAAQVPLEADLVGRFPEPTIDATCFDSVRHYLAAQNSVAARLWRKIRSLA